MAAGLGAEGGLVEVTEPGQTGEALFLLAPGLVAGASQADNPHTERGAVDASDATALTDPLGNPLYLPYRNYTDAAACARRVYRSAFAPLDAWFATGDLLSRDVDGFFFFQDRAGDSYRWKGHNVVSNEVAEVVAQFDQARVEECNVYGVTWPAQGEGRVGMACLLWREIMPTPARTADNGQSLCVSLCNRLIDPLIHSHAHSLVFFCCLCASAQTSALPFTQFLRSARQIEGDRETNKRINRQTHGRDRHNSEREVPLSHSSLLSSLLRVRS